MKNFQGRLHFCTALIVLCSMAVLDVGPAVAGLAPSLRSGVTTVATARDADMLVATRGLENKVVAQKLRDYGISPVVAQERLANMSDQDLHRLASASRGLPSGADGGTGAIIGVLVVVILVIVVLKLMNKDVIVR
jgi:hypothetical protein